jgi:hypothetical protein
MRRDLTKGGVIRLLICVLILLSVSECLLSQDFSLDDPVENIGPENTRDSSGPLDISGYLTLDDPVEAARQLRLHAARYGLDLYDRELSSAPSGEKDIRISSDKIRLPGNKILTTPSEIDTSLVNKIESMGMDAGEDIGIVTIIGFRENPNLYELILLMENGVEFLVSLNQKTSIIRLPVAAANNVLEHDFLAWAVEYKSEFKYDPEEEITDKGLRIYSFKGDREEFRRDLQSMGLVISHYDSTLNCYIIPGLQNDIDSILHLWWVKKAHWLPVEIPEALNYEPDDSRQVASAFWSGKTGSGVTLGVRDNGVFAGHPDLTGVTASSNDSDDSHGTHVTGIIIGRGLTDIEGSYDAKGVAYNGSVLFRSYHDNSYSADFSTFNSNGVQISNHSYGLGNYNYSSTTEDYDAYCDNDDMVIIKSSGNNGTNPTNPGTGKNVVTVGAITYVTAGGETLGELAGYSNEGPTFEDGRLKPELVAPGGGDGDYTYGVVACNDNPNGTSTSWEWPSNDNYDRKSGTSMAAPHVTGVCGLIKEWSASIGSELLKALLINTTIPIKENSSSSLGAYANTEVGYGLVNGFSITSYYSGEAQRLLYATGWIREDDATLYDDWTATVPSGAKKLIVTMAYNDQEGEASSSDALNDDMDLILISPGGSTYYAYAYLPSNVDTESPLEKIVITDPRSGDWTVRVRFYSSPGFGNPLIYAEQEYGLVAHAILKTPALSVSIPQSSIKMTPGEEFTVTPTVQNTGGYLAVGVTVRLDGSSAFGGEINTTRYLNNLFYQNAGKSRSFTLTAPTSPGQYQIDVEADGINKEFDNSSYPKTTTLTVNFVPEKVTNVLATDGECDEVNIFWDDVSGESGYKIYRSGEHIATEGANTTRYDDDGGTPYVTYNYTVRAYNAYGDGPLSDGETGFSSEEPYKVNGVNASTDYCDKIVISWTDVAHETYYYVYRDGDPVSGQIPANQTSYTDNPACGTYDYTVRAFNDCGGGLYSDPVSGTRKCFPPKVSGVDASDDLCEEVEITWNQMANSNGYKILRDGGQIGSVGAGTTDYVDEDAIGCSDYSVKAYNDCGDGPESDPDQGCAVSPVSKVQNVNASENSTTEVVITWNDAEDEQGYKVYRDAMEVCDVGAGITTCTDYPDVGCYNYTVKGYNVCGDGTTSDPDEGCRLETVEPDICLSVDSAYIYKEWFDDPVPSVFTFFVINCGGETITWDYSFEGDTDYFSFECAEDPTLAVGDSNFCSIMTSVAPYSPSGYYARLIICDTGDAAVCDTLHIIYEVEPSPPLMCIDASVISFSAYQNGPLPEALPIPAYKCDGDLTMEWELALTSGPAPEWMEFTGPLTGTSDTVSTQVAVTTADLIPGLYQYTFNVICINCIGDKGLNDDNREMWAELTVEYSVLDSTQPIMHVFPDTVYGSHLGFDDYDMPFYIENQGNDTLYFEIDEHYSHTEYMLTPTIGYVLSGDTSTIIFNYYAYQYEDCPHPDGIEIHHLPIHSNDSNNLCDTITIIDTTLNQCSLSIEFYTPEEYHCYEADTYLQTTPGVQSYSGYLCGLGVEIYCSLDQGLSWESITYVSDENWFLLQLPDTSMIDMWLRSYASDYGCTDADTVKHISVYQPDAIPPGVDLISPSAGEMYSSGDSIYLKWNSSDNQLIAMDSVFWSEDGLTWNYIDFYYGQRDSCLWVIPDTYNDSLLFKIAVFDVACNDSSIVSYIMLGGAKYVDCADGDDTNPGTYALPYATITKAITEIEDNDTIYVFPGECYDSLFIKKGLTLIGMEGPDSTILNALENRRCVLVDTVPDTVTISGLSLTGGDPQDNTYDNRGGGILAVASNIKIDNCRIYGNQSYSGGGLNLRKDTYFEITNSYICHNVAQSTGGGIATSDATGGFITRTAIHGNSANDNGGGIFLYANSAAAGRDFVMLNNVVTNNLSGIQGGGIETRRTDLDLRNTIVAHNDGEYGIYIYETDFGNDYNDVWGNTSADYNPGITPGGNSISMDPIFTGDTACVSFALDSCSPCVDAGDPSIPPIGPPGDMRSDIGIEDQIKGSNCLPPYDGPVWHVSTAGSDLGGNGSVEYPFATIQYAIDHSGDGDTVLILAGTYSGEGNRDINMSTEFIVVMGPDDGREEVIIDCESSSEGFVFDEGTSDSSKLMNLTITNATNGIHLYGVRASFINLVITQNSVTGIRQESPPVGPRLISNCEISFNSNNGIELKHESLDSILIEDCQFLNNGNNAITMTYYSIPSNILVKGCTFANNGSGIRAVVAMEPQLSADSCTFEGNNRGVYGNIDISNSDFLSGVNGAGCSTGPYGKHCTVTNCTFENMTGVVLSAGEYLNVSDSYINNNPGTVLGGGANEEEYCHVGISHCIISNNGGGISLSTPGEFDVMTFNMGNCLYVHNGGPVGFTSNARGSCSINNNTISDNYDDGVYIISGPYASFTANVANSIVSGNLSCGIYIGGDVAYNISCCNVFDNIVGNYCGIPDQTGINDNISVDPIFCPGQYTLYGHSPCAANNSPCGSLIGSANVACWLAGDTLRIGNMDYMTCLYVPTMYFPIYLNNHQPLEGGTIPLCYDWPFDPDSVSFVGTRLETMDYYTAVIDSLNNQINMGFVADLGSGNPPLEPIDEFSSDSCIAKIYFTYPCDTLQLCDTTYLNSVDTCSIELTYDTLYLMLLDTLGTEYIPVVLKDSIQIEQYRPGETNGDCRVNVSDVWFLLNHIFNDAPEPVCHKSGDANGDCIANISDAVYLLNYIFHGGSPPVPYCYNSAYYSKLYTGSAQLAINTSSDNDVRETVISIGSDQDVYAVQLEFAKTAGTDLLEVTSLVDGMQIHCGSDNELIKIGLIDITARHKIASSHKDIIRLRYHAADDLRLANAILVGKEGGELEYSLNSLEESIPDQFELCQNIPNPFNPNTEIRFKLPTACHVKLEIFNILGRRVAILTDDYHEAGEYRIEWRGRDLEGQPVSSGIYFYRLQAGGFGHARKMLLLR